MNEIILLFKKVSPLQRRYKQFSYGGGGGVVIPFKAAKHVIQKLSATLGEP